jgi:hypothetical protein
MTRPFFIGALTMTESRYLSHRMLILIATTMIVLVVIASGLWGSRLQLAPIATLDSPAALETPAPAEEVASGIDEVAQMEALWAEKGAASYVLVIQYNSFGDDCSDRNDPSYAITITIKDEQITDAVGPDSCARVVDYIPGGITIKNLFAEIDRCYQNSPQCRVVVMYDPENGAPITARFDREVQAIDDEWFVQVIDIIPQN